MFHDNLYIERCLSLASIGLGRVQPNPMVGCVIIHNNKIIGEGYHQKYGYAHAEVNAVNSVKDKKLLKNSQLYVNLEPCSHYGKTPPCAEMIVRYKIPTVIIGTIDPFALVKGKGVEILRKGGCNVTTGILEKKCIEINKRFFTYHNKKRPYVILKWAETKDGFVDIIRDKNRTNRPTWITDSTCRMLVHKWRSEEQAILCGKNTAFIDNPMLNIRNWDGNNPLRCVVDKNLSLPAKLNIYDKSQKTIIYNQKKDTNRSNEIAYVQLDFSKDIIPQILNDLYKRGIQSIIIEGGPKTIQSYINNNLWDEARVFIGGIEFNDGIKAPVLGNYNFKEKVIGNSKLRIYSNR